MHCQNCGLANPAAAPACARCGARLDAAAQWGGYASAAPAPSYGPPLAGASYHPPQQYAPPAPLYGAWRDRDALVLVKGTRLPARCVKCNAPAENGRFVRKMRWHEPWLYVTILAGVLVYAIVAAVISKTATVELWLCEEHKGLRTKWIALNWAACLVAVVCFVAAANASGGLVGLFVVAAFLLLLGSLVGWILVSGYVKPSKIDDRYVWVKGAGADYLANFPPVP